LIHPVLLYGIETWLLRKRKNGLYMSRYNFELDREFKSPNVMGIVKSTRLRYAEHMIRGANDLPQRALFRAGRQAKPRKTEIQESGWREQR
jgi:hypothetical protein